MKATETSTLPASAYAILGLLTFGEQSGYDLQKFVEKSVGHFFDPAKSQIYSELRRLVEAGYASERPVPQDDRPDKRMYRATSAGERALRDWLATPPADDVYRSPFFIRVFFGHLMKPEVLLEQVRAYRQRIVDELEELEATERDIKDAEPARFPYFTLRAGLISLRATTRWCDEVIRELAKEAGR
jgi:DNA-binding PadR family transcriptional regulator